MFLQGRVSVQDLFWGESGTPLQNQKNGWYAFYWSAFLVGCLVDIKCFSQIFRAQLSPFWDISVLVKRVELSRDSKSKSMFYIVVALWRWGASSKFGRCKTIFFLTFLILQTDFHIKMSSKCKIKVKEGVVRILYYVYENQPNLHFQVLFIKSRGGLPL